MFYECRKKRVVYWIWFVCFIAIITCLRLMRIWVDLIECKYNLAFLLNFIVYVYLPNGLNHLGNLTSSPDIDGRDAELKLDAALEFPVRDDDAVELIWLLDVSPSAASAVFWLMPLQIIQVIIVTDVSWHAKLWFIIILNERVDCILIDISAWVLSKTHRSVNACINDAFGDEILSRISSFK